MNDLELLRAAGFSEAEILQHAGFAPEEVSKQGAGAAPYQSQQGAALEHPLATTLLQAGNAGLLGFGDEIAAGGNALIDAFTGGPGYDARLAEARAALKTAREVDPAGSFVNELAGGIIGGGRGLLNSAGKAMEVGNTAAAMGRGAKAGALGAAVFGLGEGEGDLKNRAINAAKMVPAGIVLGGAIPGVVGAAQATLSSRPVQSVISRLGGEAGAIGPQGRSTTPLTEELLRITENIAPEKLANAEGALSTAIADKSPMFLPEAIDMPSVYRAAKGVANRIGGLDVAGTAIEARKQGQGARLGDIFNLLSEETDAESAGSKLQAAATKLIEEQRKIRNDWSRKEYGALHSGVGSVDEKAVTSLIEKSPKIRSYIRKAQEYSDLSDLPDNHMAVLDKAYQLMRDDAEKIGNTTLAGEAGKLRDNLDKATSGEFKRVREGYASLMGNLEGLTNDSVDMLHNLEKGELEAAGDKLFRLPAKQIGKVREILGPKNEGAFRDMARAYLQKKINSTKDNFNILNAGDFATKAGRNRLKAAIGEDDFARLEKELEREQKYAKGNNTYKQDSPTHGYFQDELDTADRRQAIAKAMFKPMRAIKKGLYSFLGEENKIKDSALASALFNPERALAELQALRQIQQTRYDYLRGLENKVLGTQLNLTDPARAASYGQLTDALRESLRKD